MQLFRKVIMVMVVLSLFSCVTTITTRSVIQPVNNDVEKQKLTDAVSYVLMENGFSIKLINESFGIVTSEWRDIKSGEDTAANILGALAVGLAAASGSQNTSYTSYSRKMMIEVKTTDNGYQVIPKLARISNKSSVYNNSESSNVTYPDRESKEGQIVIKIVEEINQLLGIPNNYIWEEKVVEVQ
jgi:uncharacterized lipoprotein